MTATYAPMIAATRLRGVSIRQTAPVAMMAIPAQLRTPALVEPVLDLGLPIATTQTFVPTTLATLFLDASTQITMPTVTMEMYAPSVMVAPLEAALQEVQP